MRRKNRMRVCLLMAVMLCGAIALQAQIVNVVTGKGADSRELYAAEYLQKKLTDLGYVPVLSTDGNRRKADFRVVFICNEAVDSLSNGRIRFEKPIKSSPVWQEAYNLLPLKNEEMHIVAFHGSGAIYGAVEYADLVKHQKRLDVTSVVSEPEMVIRGTCIGLQKTTYLPGHSVYEYPYTPENFPWFYDKAHWVRYLDMLVENKMNSLYLWNGHPFASLVKLKDYPFALEVDEETFRKNEEIYTFLTREADRRGITVIQMFYNIILSKPFADHYGLKTQDRNRPITPLIADYTRKSIAAFVEKYPNVGLLVCLGEAMATIEADVTWMKETIIPGILDGLRARGGGAEPSKLPPIVLRSHDTDGPLVLKESLPLYPNIYTMSKYTGESLTTYEPGGPWGETHRQLAAATPVHIDNVHILANLEPWRWSSPLFIQRTVQAMHRVHHAKGLHLYPQASYWDWPFTADRLPDDRRMLQTNRDWMWYKAWGRYAWCSNGCNWSALDDTRDDSSYWKEELADYYGIDTIAAGQLLRAYNESGEIAPKLLRRFGITEGNRQTLLLGMKMAQLVNPYKFNVYPGFYESCGPEGEKLIEYVEKEWKKEPHSGELPLDVAAECVAHGKAAALAYDAASKAGPLRHAEEFRRIGFDMANYMLFAHSFQQKVLAAEQVLNYKWTKDVKYLDAAVPLLENSLALWKTLARMTEDTYLYANSMQTAQRRIPVGGDGGNFKTWTDMVPVYEEELAALKANIERLKNPVAQPDVPIRAAKPAKVTILPHHPTPFTHLTKGAVLFENREDTRVDSIAPELARMQALVLNRDTTRIKGTTIHFKAGKPVKMLVGFFQDDDPKWAKAPTLETDATGNEYGQAEPLLTNAVSLVQMPKVNIHAYSFPAGEHTIRLPKGIIMVAGFTTEVIKPRDCGLNGAGNEVDWLFQR